MRGPETTAAGWLLRFLRRDRAVAVEQASFLSELVEFAAAFDKLCRCVKLSHSPLVQNDDPVGVDDRVDAVRNCDDSPIRKDAAAQGALQECVRLYINGSLSLLLARIVNQYQRSQETLTVASSRTRILLGVNRARARFTS
jgi:hypothetical protein